MGNQQVKKSEEDEDIISKESLEVVKDVITLLKRHSREEGLFRRSGRLALRQQILDCLRRGEKLQIPRNPDTARECAVALQLFLMQMQFSVMPRRVQQLVLADNPGISAHTVANDALGLIRQDVTGLHSEFLFEILGLLRHLLVFPSSERSELRASSLLVIFLPIFFDFTTDDLTKWRLVASRLHELIIEAPKHLSDNKPQLRYAEHEVSVQGSISLSRFRDLPLFNPLYRLIENRRNSFLDPIEATRSTRRQSRRPLAGRLHPAIIRTRT